MTELETKYNEEFKAKLKKELGIENDMRVPTLTKVIVNAGIGKEYRTNSKVVEEMQEIIAQITGQAPVVTKAKDSIANFKLREDMPNGVKVTLRGDKMWNFYNKLVNIALPRVKDFRGVSDKSFDNKGGYSLGIKEHTIFPEIDPNKLTRIRSLQVVVVTTAETNDEARALLKMLGMPFRKSRNSQ